jgi:hypothetical protein
VRTSVIGASLGRRATRSTGPGLALFAPAGDRGVRQQRRLPVQVCESLPSAKPVVRLRDSLPIWLDPLANSNRRL